MINLEKALNRISYLEIRIEKLESKLNEVDEYTSKCIQKITEELVKAGVLYYKKDKLK